MEKAISVKNKIIFFFSVQLVFVALDQWSKAWAVEALKGSYPRRYFFGIFQLTYAENTGAWGNLGGDWGEPYRSLFLIYLPIGVLVLFAIFSLFSKKINNTEFWAYAFIVSGGAGNLIDRVRFGYVVDFMYAGIKRPFETNIFNVADVVIMTGFGLIVLNMVKDYLQKRNSTAQTSE